MPNRLIPRLLLGAALALLPAGAHAAPKGKKGKAKKAEPAAPAQEDPPPAEGEAGDGEAPPADASSGDAAPGNAPAPAPAATPAPSAAPPPEPVVERVDQARVDELQSRARALQDELFKSRARVSVLAASLFQSRVQLELKGNLDRFYEASNFTLTLDGAPVFQAETGLGRPGAMLVDAYAAPGAHELEVSATLVARRDPTYRIRVRQSFTIVVPERSTVSSKLVLRESGNMWNFTRKRRGAYRVRMDLKTKAKSTDKGGGKAAPKAKAKATASASGGTKK